MELLKEGDTVIGIGEGFSFQEGETTVDPGDRLFAYTDGITEYRNADGEFFGEARFYQCIERFKNKSIHKHVNGIIDVMMDFGCNKPPGDDVSLFGLSFAGRGKSD